MKIQSPISGLIIPLEQVPDEVFSQKMVGDGLAIEPTDSTLYSPVSGTVDFVHPSQHAVTLKSTDGITILMHIGIDTVQLKGQGFKSLVKAGDVVSVGDKLIEFDFDFVSKNAKYLMTLVLVTEAEKYQFNFNSSIDSGRKINFVQAKKSVLFEVSAKPENFKAQKNISSQSYQIYSTESFPCELHTGLHARPAASIVQTAKKFESDIFIIKNNQNANAKSVVSILALSVGHSDLISIESQSMNAADTKNAAEEIKTLIQSGLGESLATKPKTKEKSILTPQKMNRPKNSSPNEFYGVTASPGLVFGEIKQLKLQDVTVEKSKDKKNPDHELTKFNQALLTAQKDLSDILSKLKSKADEDKSNIFKAHLEILADPEVLSSTQNKIKNGLSSEYAWQESIREIKTILQSLQNEVMAGRAHDLHDVGQRVLKIMLGIKTENPLIHLDKQQPVILVAQSLTPSDMAFMNADIIKGLCTVEGGASSHVAIIARSMGIASIAAVDSSLLDIADNTMAILYGQKSYLKIKPDAAEIDRVQSEIFRQDQKLVDNKKSAQASAVTLDGETIHVFANIGKLPEAMDAVTNGAEGVGLLRSEFLFLHRATAPSEQEQLQKYQDIVSALNNDQTERPVIIRTLDVGGDKPLTYLPMPAEENPFLGVRGLRLSLQSQDIFRTQLRALLQVKPISALQIMFPMVTTLSELIEAKKILKEECDKLKIPQISTGIMIEVPSAALMADVLAPHVDFFSIGSNDLTQYTLAIDRGHRDLAAMADGLHPSVLKLIKITCDAANKHKKMVGVCGGIAGDHQAVPLLIGLGVHELSVSVPVIPHIKAQIRKLKKSDCILLAEKALKLAEASEVRQIVSDEYL